MKSTDGRKITVLYWFGIGLAVLLAAWFPTGAASYVLWGWLLGEHAKKVKCLSFGPIGLIFGLLVALVCGVFALELALRRALLRCKR